MPAPPRRFIRFVPATAALIILSVVRSRRHRERLARRRLARVAVVGFDEPIQPALDSVATGVHGRRPGRCARRAVDDHEGPHRLDRRRCHTRRPGHGRGQHL